MVRSSTSAPFPATVTRIAPLPEMPGVRRADSRVRGLDRPRGPAAETSGTSAGAIAKRRISPHRPRVWSASGREPMRNPAKRHVTMRTHYRWHMWRIDPRRFVVLDRPNGLITRRSHSRVARCAPAVLCLVARRKSSYTVFPLAGVQGSRFTPCPRYEEHSRHSYMCRGFSRLLGGQSTD
jgi:hypothetical protein